MKGLFSVHAPKMKVKLIYYMTGKRAAWLPDLPKNGQEGTSRSGGADVAEVVAAEDNLSSGIDNLYMKDSLATEWPPKHHKILMDTDDADVKLSFVDSRKFAKIARLRVEKVPEVEESRVPEVEAIKGVIDRIWDAAFDDLAADPLLRMPSQADFLALCRSKGNAKQQVKIALLDQSRLVCGVGNWLADDILYDCSLHPQRTLVSLSDAEVESLRKSIWSICDISCNVANADSKLFPPHWLFHVRWGAQPGKVDLKRPQLQLLEVGGRTAVVDPNRQIQPEGAADRDRVRFREEKQRKLAKQKDGKQTEKLKSRNVKKGGSAMKQAVGRKPVHDAMKSGPGKTAMQASTKSAGKPVKKTEAKPKAGGGMKSVMKSGAAKSKD